MTHILPVFAATATALVLAVTPLATADETNSPIAGNTLVEAAIQSLLQQPNLEAKIRQRATVFGQLLSGAGLYVQSRDADRLLVRFEFRIQVADKSTALLQINDGSTLWIRRDVDQLQSQAYVDLRRLREALNRQSNSEVGRNVPSHQMLAVGGLPQLLDSLADHFDFGKAATTEVASIPMWELTGEWKREQLLRLLPDQRDRIASGQAPDWSRLASHLPTTVKLTLGRDRNFPLFPYRIEYGRSQPAPGSAAGGPPAQIVRPMVTMELFEVRRRPDLTADLFTYSPGDHNVEVTDQYLQQLAPSFNPQP